MQNWIILVVEDDPGIQEFIETLLRHQQVAVDAVTSAEEALEALASGKPYTAVIIDLALPRLDGWSLLMNIRNNAATAHIPCIAMSGYHSPGLSEKAVEAGFRAYFSKPFDASFFVDELQRVLA